MNGIKDRVAVIGMGCTKFGERWDSSAADLIVEAAYEAYEDAGIEGKDIQAAWLGTVASFRTGQPLAAALKLDSTPIRLSDQPGTVFTFSLDYLAGTVDTPLAIVVVDFEPGGRVLCMMTDREISEVQIGLSVEMSFRKLRVVNGIHNYYWKAVPRRRVN